MGGGVPREGRRKTGHSKYRWRLHGYAGPALPVALAALTRLGQGDSAGAGYGTDG